jgi:hypothetical protein
MTKKQIINGILVGFMYRIISDDDTTDRGIRDNACRFEMALNLARCFWPLVEKEGKEAIIVTEQMFKELGYEWQSEEKTNYQAFA